MKILKPAKKDLAKIPNAHMLRRIDANARASGRVRTQCLRSDGNVSEMNFADLNVGVIYGDDHERSRVARRALPFFYTIFD
jgi:hypothetical protein